MPTKTNEGWIEEFNEFFKGNIAKDSTLRCNTKYVKDFIRTLLTEKDKELQKAREESGKRNVVVKEYKDEGVMFILKVEDGKTYEASMPIPKWAEVGKLTLRDQSELDQPITSE